MAECEKPTATSDGAKPPSSSDEEPTLVAAVADGQPASAGQPTSTVAVPIGPQRRREHRRLRSLAVVGAVVLLGALAVVVPPVAWKAASPAGNRMSAPQTVSGLVREDSPGADDTTDRLRTALAGGLPLTSTIGAVYADASGAPRSVVFVAGVGTLRSPTTTLRRAFTLVADEAGQVGNIHTVAVGPSGGAMQCGSTDTETGSTAVCGWADQHSLGVAIFPNRPVEQAAALLRTIHQAAKNTGDADLRASGGLAQRTGARLIANGPDRTPLADGGLDPW
jgi:hypothetical protein